MDNTNGFFSWRYVLRILAIALILAALTLTGIQWQQYSGTSGLLPAGSTLAAVPVGGLSAEAAVARAQAAFAVPVELRVDASSIQAAPEALGFSFDHATVLAQLQGGAGASFWDSLLGRQPAALEIPLTASIDEARLRAYLDETIAPRYSQPATPALPVAGSTRFIPGTPGRQLDIAAALPRIEAALRSLTARSIDLPVIDLPAGKPDPRNLQILLQHTLDLSGFDGYAEVYVHDLASGETIDFARRQGQELIPGIAFTAASTIKIPIMVAALRRAPEPVPQYVLDYLDGMIARSENPPADSLMQTLIDPLRGPLEVSADLRALGYQNTFLAGFFYTGAPLLEIFNTPANQRADVNLQPDTYNQTVPAEMGDLLAAIYACAKDGSGKLSAAFPGEITQSKCQLIITELEKNKIAVLSEAGVPAGITVAHKHGWTPDADQVLRTVADVALIRSPGGDFVLSIYLHDPDQLLFEPANLLVARLTEAIYSYFNVYAQ